MTEITINPVHIFAAMYVTFKAFTSIWICKHEFQYPIWNSDGVQIPRGTHHKVRSFLRNWAINPEWGLIKAVAFAPVFLVTGKRFIYSFMPWHVQKTPPVCQICRDKGRYYNSFLTGKKNWQICKCQHQKEPPAISCSCPVCLDQHTIGKNRLDAKFASSADAEYEHVPIPPRPKNDYEGIDMGWAEIG